MKGVDEGGELLEYPTGIGSQIQGGGEMQKKLQRRRSRFGKEYSFGDIYILDTPSC